MEVFALLFTTFCKDLSERYNMKVKIICSGCKKELVERNVLVPSYDGDKVTVEVSSCKSIDCYDCSQCEELQQLKDKVKKLEAQFGEGSAKPAQKELQGVKDQPRKNLQPTNDIQQGNTVIPGIKKNSAVGTQADYRKIQG